MSAVALGRMTVSIANATPRDGDRSAMTGDAMTRRTLVPLLVLALLAAPLAAEAQQARKVPRVTVVWIAPAPAVTDMHDAFREGLRERGWVEGRR
jgi:hypothetical protein